MKFNTLIQEVKRSVKAKKPSQQIKGTLKSLAASAASLNRDGGVSLPSTSSVLAVTGNYNEARLKRTFLMVDGNAKLSHVHDSIVLVTKDLKISHCKGSVVIAGGKLKVSHDGNDGKPSLIIGGTTAKVSHAHDSVISVRRKFKVSHATPKSYGINCKDKKGKLQIKKFNNWLW